MPIDDWPWQTSRGENFIDVCGCSAVPSSCSASPKVRVVHVVCEIVYLDLSMIYLDLVEVDSVDAARLKARPLLGVTGIESTHVDRVHMLDRPSTCSTLKWEHSLFVPVEFGQNCKIQTPVLSDVLSVCVSCSSTFLCFSGRGRMVAL